MNTAVMKTQASLKRLVWEEVLRFQKTLRSASEYAKAGWLGSVVDVLQWLRQCSYVVKDGATKPERLDSACCKGMRIEMMRTDLTWQKLSRGFQDELGVLRAAFAASLELPVVALIASGGSKRLVWTTLVKQSGSGRC